MEYIKSYNLFESSITDDIDFDSIDGNLLITIGKRKFIYKIEVDTGLLDLSVKLDKIIKNREGGFDIQGKLGFVGKQVALSKSRVDKIIQIIKTGLEKTKNPPESILCQKEKPNQKSFTLSLVKELT